jgi:acetyltransferase-like isoleucine patch superfamily enzyme
MLSPRRIVAWIYGAWLTWRYVDECSTFPAIVFRDGLVRIRVTKAAGAHWRVGETLVAAPWLGGGGSAHIHLDEGARLEIEHEFHIGQDVRIYVGRHARLELGGRVNETASGITCRAIVMVRRSVLIGSDCIVGWDTFITDCDWHQRLGHEATAPTAVGDHVWVGTGARILRGAQVGSESIVAAGSVVGAGIYPQRALLAGVPARAVATDIEGWRRDLAADA